MRFYCYYVYFLWFSNFCFSLFYFLVLDVLCVFLYFSAFSYFLNCLYFFFVFMFHCLFMCVFSYLIFLLVTFVKKSVCSYKTFFLFNLNFGLLRGESAGHPLPARWPVFRVPQRWQDAPSLVIGELRTGGALPEQ